MIQFVMAKQCPACGSTRVREKDHGTWIGYYCPDCMPRRKFALKQQVRLVRNATEEGVDIPKRLMRRKGTVTRYIGVEDGYLVYAVSFPGRKTTLSCFEDELEAVS